MIVLISDNGASMEGGDNGVLNEYARHNGLEVHFDEIVANIDRIGAPGTLNNYPKGWSMAGNTPFREWKRYTYQGGIADPLIMHWPAGIQDRGAIRGQYHHVSDLMPTVLEALDIEPPASISGVPQSDIEGVSMWYSVLDGAAEGTQEGPVLRDAGRPRHLLRRMEGGRRPRADEQHRQLRPGPLGAVLPARRPQRDP